MRDGRKEPLFRKVNTRTHGVKHAPDGGEARWDRTSKAGRQNEAMRGSMHPGHRHGLDYTPLFRFLVSRVGQVWDAVHAEAMARLDRPDPIFWLVALRPEEERAHVRVGESSYWSGLRVDEANRLAKVAPELTVEDMVPSCACCTHTFNGQRFTRAFAAAPADAGGTTPDR